MILTCPNCSTRFELPEDMLLPNGRKVKCSSCEETWFQLPEEPSEAEEVVEAPAEEQEAEVDTQEEAVDIAEEPAEDVPEEDTSEENEEAGEESEESEEAPAEDSSEEEKPTEESETEEIAEEAPSEDGEASEEAPAEESEEDELRIKPEEEVEKRFTPQTRNAYLAASGVFVLLFLILLMLSGPLMRAVPGFEAIYGVFGLKADLPGQDLTFEEIKISRSHEGKITINVKIMNIGDKQRGVPMIMTTLKGEDGEVLDHLMIEPPHGTIDAHGVMPLEAFYESEKSNEIHNVDLKFVLNTKTASKDGGNTPAHDEGDAAHQSDHGADAKSPAHASEKHHQEHGHSNSGSAHH